MFKMIETLFVGVTLTLGANCNFIVWENRDFLTLNDPIGKLAQEGLFATNALSYILVLSYLRFIKKRKDLI